MAFGQSPYKKIADQNKPEKPTIDFDALNGAIVQERELALKNFLKADSAMSVIVTRMLQVKKIDFTLISKNPDSTKVTPEGIFLKLKPKNK